MSVEKIGVSKKGIETYALENRNGMRVEVITYGARLHKILLPSKMGTIDVLAGFDDVDGYTGVNPYFNATIGRFVNRIGRATLTLNGKTYDLRANEGRNCLHGGKVGFDRRTFTCETVGDNAVKLTYVSPDGEENLPSELTISVMYTLTDENELKIRYDAIADGDTIFNPTNHAYFNLDGDFVSVLDTKVFIDSTKMTLPDAELVSTGIVADIQGTNFDFSKERTIGEGIDKENEWFKNALGGYDFNYTLREDRDVNKPAATAYSEKSGIKMEVYTDRPCLQLYSGNFLDGSVVGKKGNAYPYQSAFCMETQKDPSAYKSEAFPSVLLKGKEKFVSETVYAFRWKPERS